ncbi:MAG: O-antigen ligase family protein [Candidatus Omnitrophota bacterium]
MIGNILFILILARPFISSLSYPALDLYYTYLLIAAFIIVIKLHIPKAKNIPGQVYLLLFLSALIASTIFSSDPQKSLTALPTYLAYIFVFLGVYVSSNAERKHILHALIASGALVSLYAIYWFYLGSRHFLDYLQKEQIYYPYALELLSRNRAFMPFVVPGALSGFLIMMLPLAIGNYWQQKKQYKDQLAQNTILIFFIAITIFALFLTKSVGASLSLFITVIIFLWSIRPKNIPFVLIVSLLGILALLFLLRNNNAEDFTTPLFSLQKRWVYWRQTAAVIARHPFLGTGVGNLPFVQSRYAHNLFLQLWAETGILGIVTFLGFIATCYRLALTKIKDPLWAGCFVAFVSFLIHNMFDFSFFLPETCLFWWIIAALLLL